MNGEKNVELMYIDVSTNIEAAIVVVLDLILHNTTVYSYAIHTTLFWQASYESNVKSQKPSF